MKEKKEKENGMGALIKDIISLDIETQRAPYMEKDFIGATKFTNLCNGLNDTDFVVDGHDGHQGRLGTDSLFKFLFYSQYKTLTSNVNKEWGHLSMHTTSKTEKEKKKNKEKKKKKK
jgi:hypothetical protein